MFKTAYLKCFTIEIYKYRVVESFKFCIEDYYTIAFHKDSVNFHKSNEKYL